MVESRGGAGPPGFSCRPYLQRNWDKRGCATKKNCAVIYRDEPKAKKKKKKIVMGWGGGSQDLQHLSDQETRGTDKSCCSAQGQRSKQMPGRRQHMIGALRRPLRRGLGRGGGQQLTRGAAPQVCKSSDVDELLGCGLLVKQVSLGGRQYVV